MKDSTFKELNRGDLIRHKNHSTTFIVSANYGKYITAITSVDMSNPSEWDLVLKANYDQPKD